jgi:cytidylate kinase
MAKQFIIAIAREYGSGGRVIAEELAKRYNVNLYGKNLLDFIAKEKNLNLDKLKKYDEKARNPWLSRTVDGYSNSPEDTVAQMQFDYLKERADSGESFVVLGRCASYILRDSDGLVKIFITGEKGAKIKRIASIEKLNYGEAQILVEKRNKMRRNYHNYYSKEKWGDSRHYDLIVNSSKIGIDNTVDVIDKYIENVVE